MNKILFIEYPKCSTCQKARHWLEERHIEFESRHIVENNPNIKELKEWHKKSNLPLNKFFNTSGLRYKALNLKEKLPKLDEEKQIELLASDGMLIKRPLVISDNFVLIGFKENDWKSIFQE